MELSLILAQSIASMGIMIVIGYIIVKTHLLPFEASKYISSLILYVIQPCIILNAYLIDYSRERLAGLGICAIAAVAAHLLFILFEHVTGRALHLSNVDRASLVYTNNGNLIVPLISAILGSEYVFYASAYMSAFNLFFWIHGVRLIGNEKKVNVRKIVTNPNLIAVLAGLIIFITKCKLPVIVENTISSMYACIGPLSMIGIGMLMATFNLKKILSDPHAYLVSLLRLIVLPIIFILLLRLTGLTYRFPQLQMILVPTVLAVAAPTAVSVPQYAEVCGCDAKQIADGGTANVMSTIFSMVTLPVMIFIYQALCF